jgi:hypothetical protein
MSEKPQVCLVSCSVLKQELQQLKAQGKLDAELVFVSKNFHIDYKALETNLRRVLEHTKKRFHGKLVLVYGDLCLGQDGEMKKLSEEYHIVKVDALNCIDCQLGGKGKFLEADPEHNLMFMGPGMIEFFSTMKDNLKKEGIDEAAFAGMFNGIRGIVLLDTCDDAEKCRQDFQKLGSSLEVLETRSIGSQNVLSVVLDAIDQASRIK